MTLFRNVKDLDHWYVPVARGWLRFPARANGWCAARVVRHLDETHLQPVPVWLAFNTGMPLKRGRKADNQSDSSIFSVSSPCGPKIHAA